MVCWPSPLPVWVRVVGEHGEMHRRFLEAGKLQPGIDRLLLPGIAGQRPLVGVGEAFHDRKPSFGRVHMHEAPGLAQPDRRRMARDLEQRVDALARDGIGAKAPDVAPPQHEIAELRAEGGVERRCHACRLSMK